MIYGKIKLQNKNSTFRMELYLTYMYDTIQTAFFGRFFAIAKINLITANIDSLELLNKPFPLMKLFQYLLHFHASTGRTRKHQLYAVLCSYSVFFLLIDFLKFSQEFRDFCGFDIVPDASKFTRFKQNFLLDLQSMFDYRPYELYKAAFDSIEIYKYLLRTYSGTVRGTDEWDATYKIRVDVEKSIHHFKDSFCVAGRKTQNEKTLHADLLLVGITQLITVLVAVKLHKHEYIRSLKPLIA